MTRVVLLFVYLLTGAALAQAAPTDFIFSGMPGYELQKQSRRFQQQAIEFQLPESRKTRSVSREGYLTQSRYAFTMKVKAVSAAIVEHYAQALEKIGGEILSRKDDTLHGTFHHNGRECYLVLNVYDGGIFYFAGVLEVMDMEYEIAALGIPFPMLPNYVAGRKVKNFARLTVKKMQEGKTKPKDVTLEGAMMYTFYGSSSKDTSVNPLQIFKNYHDIIKEMGGIILYCKDEKELYASFTKNEKQYYIVMKIIQGGTHYEISILAIQNAGDSENIVDANTMINKLEQEGRIALHIYFDADKSVIKPESGELIDEIVTALTIRPNLKVKLEGHTDNTGNAAANRKLSDDRAKAVMQHLAARGINKSRLSAEGFGQDKPIASNDDEQGRFRNRRIEMIRQ